jgi:hypothetical protein
MALSCDSTQAPWKVVEVLTGNNYIILLCQ